MKTSIGKFLKNIIPSAATIQVKQNQSQGASIKHALSNYIQASVNVAVFETLKNQASKVINEKRQDLRVLANQIELLQEQILKNESRSRQFENEIAKLKGAPTVDSSEPVECVGSFVRK